MLKAALSMDRRGPSKARSQPRARSAPSQVVAPDQFRAFPARLWRRVLAGMTDVLAVGGVVGLYLLIASSLTHHASPVANRLRGLDALMVFVHAWESILLPAVALAVLISLVYSMLFVIAWKGQTPGHRLLGLKLVDDTGSVPSPSRVAVRALLSLVSTLIFLGGFWLALFDRKGQTLHDKLTSTFVVKPA